jgi:hypothetical protein
MAGMCGPSIHDPARSGPASGRAQATVEARSPFHVTSRSPDPSTIQVPPDGFEWRPEPMPNWRAPPEVTTRCWRGGCEEQPVAERPQIIQSRLRGQIETWRGFCSEHLLPLWVEERITYHWMLRPTSVGQIPPGQAPGERTEGLFRAPRSIPFLLPIGEVDG